MCSPSNAHALFTPEGYYPLILKSLPLTPSISQGLQILDSAIKTTLANNPAGSVAVLGYSQSADISSLEMLNLANPMLNPNPPTANQLGFTLLGDQMNPNGGIFARFPGFPAGQPLQLPALGLTFYGATPSNTIYPTNIYTMEYDGWADFPQYPINFISDLNALCRHRLCARHLSDPESVGASPWLHPSRHCRRLRATPASPTTT